MSISDIYSRLSSIDIFKGDVIVLNGGEPTLHRDFYKIVSLLQQTCASKIEIYTNGSFIDISKLKDNKKLSFVVPIHGDRATHIAMTKSPMLYMQTVNNLKRLEEEKFCYDVKFILNYQLVRANFNIYNFLSQNGLQPESVVLARLNATKKSKINKVQFPTADSVINYTAKQKAFLGERQRIKFIDLPFCYLGFKETDVVKQIDIPEFYFNDYNHYMVKKQYYKNTLIGINCDKCPFLQLCVKMSKTYLTLVFNKNIWSLEVE